MLAANASASAAEPAATPADGAIKGEGLGAGDANGDWGRQQAAVQQLLLQHQGSPHSLSFLGLGHVEAPLLLAGMENLDRGMYNSVLRAFRALEASAVEGEHALSQVRVLCAVCCAGFYVEESCVLWCWRRLLWGESVR